jgi:sulfide:quinone oxidoreductase
VRLTLVAPDPDFVDRPMTVLEPFGYRQARRHPLAPIASSFDATLVRAAVSELRATDRRVLLLGGGALDYDKLVLAPGARSMPAFDHAITFGEPTSSEATRELVGRLQRGEVRRVAFIAPTSVGWTLPLYELALLTARTARQSEVDAEIVLVSREERPLAVFGTQPSAMAGRWLRASDIEFIGATAADVRPGVVTLQPGGRTLPVDGVVALPLVRGPRLEGVPADDFGFIPIDSHCRVRGLEDVYAAGDATDFPVKQPGLAAQQADAVAAHIAAGLGAAVKPAPFRPVLRGMLFSGGDPQFLRTRELANADEGRRHSPRCGGRPPRSPAATSPRSYSAARRARCSDPGRAGSRPSPSHWVTASRSRARPLPIGALADTIARRFDRSGQVPLEDLKQLVLRLRFRDDLTQAEIGERVGCSQMHVSRIIRLALARLEEIAATTQTQELLDGASRPGARAARSAEHRRGLRGVEGRA